MVVGGSSLDGFPVNGNAREDESVLVKNESGSNAFYLSKGRRFVEFEEFLRLFVKVDRRRFRFAQNGELFFLNGLNCLL